MRLTSRRSRRWRGPFHCRGSRRKSAVAQLDSAAASMNTAASQSKSHVRICLTLILVSILLVTDGKIVPGGPFVSVHAEIVPVMCCLAVLFYVVRDFRAASIGRRIGLSFLALGSVGVIALVIQTIVSFCQDRFARGTLVGW